MKIKFLIPPSFDQSQLPAERSAGCTCIIYPFPNIYELTAATAVRQSGYCVDLEDFVYNNRTAASFESYIKQAEADVFCMSGVNLSIPDDLKAIEIIRRYNPCAYVIMLGPAPTFFPEKFKKLKDSNCKGNISAVDDVLILR